MVGMRKERIYQFNVNGLVFRIDLVKLIEIERREEYL
jgi:hypothetical protein